MPELPEVETVIRALRPDLVGRTIRRIEVRYAPIVEDTENFIKNLEGKTYTAIERYGKYLIFRLGEKDAYLSHLRMEGKYYYTNDMNIANKHTHVIFYLDNGYMLMYNDVRKFGRMTYKKAEDIYTTPPVSFMGIDPILYKEIEIGPVYDKIVKERVPVKSILLDQRIICGLGNIYADEVLFRAKVKPSRKGTTITKKECERIICYSQEVMAEAILLKGSTIRSYTSSLGVEGSFQERLLVHTKETCPSCKKKLTIRKIGGRTTYYCTKCQR